MKLYCFSATGNCLTTARKIAAQMENCTVVPVAATRNMHKIVEEDAEVGFVFPVYYGNMPYPVREMIGKMVFQPDTYAFIFSTWRGHAGAVASRADQLLRTRGVKLSLALGIPMPGNSFINAPEVDETYLNEQDANIAGVLDALKNREVRDYFTAELLPMTPIDYPNNFRGIAADENCIGCGTCARVCPRDNIHVEGGGAVIGDDCATCLACFHACPKQVIWMSRQENIARRSKYRHPDVTLADIIAQKGKV